MRKERKVRSGKVINSRLVKEGWYSRNPPQISLIHQTELSVRHCFSPWGQQPKYWGGTKAHAGESLCPLSWAKKTACALRLLPELNCLDLQDLDDIMMSGRHILTPRGSRTGNGSGQEPRSPGQVHLSPITRILDQIPDEVDGSRNPGLLKSHLTITKEEAPVAQTVTKGTEKGD